MFGVSFLEIALVGLVALLVVGPQKLPAMMRTAGEWVGKIRRMTADMRAQTGIDDILREEGIDGVAELRTLLKGERAMAARRNTAPAQRGYDAYSAEADPSIEFPVEGPDAYGALPDDLIEESESPEKAEAAEVAPTETEFAPFTKGGAGPDEIAPGEASSEDAAPKKTLPADATAAETAPTVPPPAPETAPTVPPPAPETAPTVPPPAPETAPTEPPPAPATAQMPSVRPPPPSASRPPAPSKSRPPTPSKRRPQSPSSNAVAGIRPLPPSAPKSDVPRRPSSPPIAAAKPPVSVAKSESLPPPAVIPRPSPPRPATHPATAKSQAPVLSKVVVSEPVPPSEAPSASEPPASSEPPPSRPSTTFPKEGDPS